MKIMEHLKGEGIADDLKKGLSNLLKKGIKKAKASDGNVLKRGISKAKSKGLSVVKKTKK